MLFFALLVVSSIKVFDSISKSTEGDTYSIGWNASGQCGFDPLLFPNIENNPQRIVISEKIIDCACGDNHSLLLSENGEIFSFGRFLNVICYHLFY